MNKFFLSENSSRIEFEEQNRKLKKHLGSIGNTEGSQERRNSQVTGLVQRIKNELTRVEIINGKCLRLGK